MKKMKRNRGLSLLLAVVMALSVLSGGLTAYGGPVRLSAENGWSYTWKGLEEKAAWTVDEPSVPDGYRKSIAHTGNNWTITNRDVQQPAGQPEPPVPQTGDEANVHAWLVMMLSALLGIAFLGGRKLYSRKRGKRS